MWTHRGHEDISCIYTAPALTRRDEGVLDSIALDEVAPYAVSDVVQKSN